MTTRVVPLAFLLTLSAALNLSAGITALAGTPSGKPHKLHLDSRPPQKFRTASERLEDLHPELLDIIARQDIARRKWEFQGHSYVPRKDDLGYVRSYEIWQADKLLYQSPELQHGYYWPLAPLPYNPEVPLSTDIQRTVAGLIGTTPHISSRNFTVEDLTGNGSQDFMVAGFSGGQNCCYSYTLFTSDGKTAKKPKTLKPLTLESRSSPFFLKDLKGNGSYQLVGSDSCFASWNCGLADSPQPLVILRIQPDQFTLAADLLKLPPVGAEYIAGLVVESQKQLSASQAQHQSGCPSGAFYLDPLIWKNMLDLIYCGNGEAAWQYLNMVWDKNLHGWREEGIDLGVGGQVKNKVTRQEFLSAFKRQLARSPYYLSLKELNHWK